MGLQPVGIMPFQPDPFSGQVLPEFCTAASGDKGSAPAAFDRNFGTWLWCGGRGYWAVPRPWQVLSLGVKLDCSGIDADHPGCAT